MNCICFPEWSVAERRKTDAARRAAAHAVEIADALFAHSLYVTGGIPLGLKDDTALCRS